MAQAAIISNLHLREVSFKNTQLISLVIASAQLEYSDTIIVYELLVF